MEPDGLVNTFSQAKDFIRNLDEVLHSLPDPPNWTLLELTQSRASEHLQQPEFSQPLVTALQLTLLIIFEEWGIKPVCVVGHSSSEIAEAVAAGLITPGEAKDSVLSWTGRKVDSYTRACWNASCWGRAGQGQKYVNSNVNLENVCYNSPSSLIKSGAVSSLETLQKNLQADGHFTTLLHVDLAYHLSYMAEIGAAYEKIVWLITLSSTPNPVGVVLVPAVLGSLIIGAQQELPGEGIALASAQFLGMGDRENPRKYGTNWSLYNPTTGALLFEMKGLTTGVIEAREEQGPGHSFTHEEWAADISMLLSGPEPKLRSYVEQTYKTTRNPKLKVLELALSPNDHSSLWLQDDVDPIRAACSGYHFALRDPTTLVRAPEIISPRTQDAEFSLFDLTDSEPISASQLFDLVIVRAPNATSPSDDFLNTAINKARKSIRPGGVLVSVGLRTSLVLVGKTHNVGEDILVCQPEMEAANTDTRDSVIIHITLTDRLTFKYHEITAEEALLKSLRTQGWDIRECSNVQDEIATSEVVLVTDELFRSVMRRLNDKL
ncbi:hypothetical protein F5B21DRAFT_505408 [Xylaria acuta]|nr:hypothetical protein F5B21DRAFT_505408 [Xylaria acuta]